jgi:PREDICTED: similar to transcription elongation regulator 1 (ca150)
MKKKINIMTRKNILLLLFLIMILLIVSQNLVNVKTINIYGDKREFNTNVDIEKIWDSSKVIKQNIKEINKDDDSNKKSNDKKNTIDLNDKKEKEKDKDKQDDKDKDKDKKENKSTEENKTETNKVEIMPETSKTRLLGLRDSSLKTLEKYRNEYRNSIIYGTIAYILHMLSLISIPIVVILLIVSYVYDSVIGLKTRSLYNKGRLIRFHVLTFFVACQLMPLIFATVIKGWGN